MESAEDHLSLAGQCYEEWEATRSPARLDAAVAAYQHALSLPWSCSEGRAECMFRLAGALSAGSDAGIEHYTDKAIDFTTQLLQIDPKNDYLTGLRGYARMLRYLRHDAIDDLEGAVLDFKQSLASTPTGDPGKYRRALNAAWACEARFDRLGHKGQPYLAIQVNGIERWRGPPDLVNPICWLETLLESDNGLPPAPPGVIPQLKRNLANLLVRYALAVKVRPQQDRVADMERAVHLLQEAMTETAAGSPDHLTSATSLVATVQQGRTAGLLPPS